MTEIERSADSRVYALNYSILTQAGTKRDSDVMEVKVGENLKEKQVARSNKKLGEKKEVVLLNETHSVLFPQFTR